MYNGRLTSQRLDSIGRVGPSAQGALNTTSPAPARRRESRGRAILSGRKGAKALAVAGALAVARAGMPRVMTGAVMTRAVMASAVSRVSRGGKDGQGKRAGRKQYCQGKEGAHDLTHEGCHNILRVSAACENGHCTSDCPDRVGIRVGGARSTPTTPITPELTLYSPVSCLDFCRLHKYSDTYLITRYPTFARATIPCQTGPIVVHSLFASGGPATLPQAYYDDSR